MATDPAVEAARAALSLPYRYDIGELDMRRAIAKWCEAEADVIDELPHRSDFDTYMMARLRAKAAALRAGT